MGFQVMVMEVRLPEVEFSDLGRPSGAALINDIIIVIHTIPIIMIV